MKQLTTVCAKKKAIFMNVIDQKTLPKKRFSLQSCFDFGCNAEQYKDSLYGCKPHHYQCSYK